MMAEALAGFCHTNLEGALSKFFPKLDDAG